MRDKLTALFRSLTQDVYTFKPGDIVEWKEGLKNRRPEGPFVIIEVFDDPIYDNNKDSGSTYYREPHDCIAAEFDNDGDFMVWHLDSRRLQPTK